VNFDVEPFLFYFALKPHCLKLIKCKIKEKIPFTYVIGKIKKFNNPLVGEGVRKYAFLYTVDKRVN